jgi:hypothetical protein
MNVIKATFIREWTDPEGSMHPGFKAYGALPDSSGRKQAIPGFSTSRRRWNLTSSCVPKRTGGRQTGQSGLAPPSSASFNSVCAQNNGMTGPRTGSNRTDRGASFRGIEQLLEIAAYQIPY